MLNKISIKPNFHVIFMLWVFSIFLKGSEIKTLLIRCLNKWGKRLQQHNRWFNNEHGSNGFELSIRNEKTCKVYIVMVSKNEELWYNVISFLKVMQIFLGFWRRGKSLQSLMSPEHFIEGKDFNLALKWECDFSEQRWSGSIPCSEDGMEKT